MFKILVADDERFIRKGILSILERNIDEPLECIEAKNGIEALAKTDQETPDLIITDINMPGCDGLEFVRKLNEKQVNTTVIILSGYENFEYAKKAITLGIKEYVMKPIKKTEFIDLIKRYMTAIQQQQLRTQEEIEQRIENNRIIEGIKKEFLVGLLKCSDNREAHQYLQQLKGLKMDFKPQLCTTVVFQYEVNPENREYMDFVAKNILDEYLSLESEDFLMNVAYDAGKMISIFKSGSICPNNEERKKIIRQAARLIREYGKVRVFAGLGDVVPDFEHLNRALCHALRAVDYKIFDRGDILCVYDEIEPGEGTIFMPLNEPEVILAVWNEINRIYAMGATQSVMDALKMRYDEVRDMVFSRLTKTGAVTDKDSVCKEFSRCWSLDEIKQELKKGLNRLTEIGSSAGQINVQLLNQVIQFVDQHITGDLDLGIVAARFNRSPGYISTMFKRHDDGGFNAYVNGKRIEIAKRLLQDQGVSVQEVAEACGYYNAKYFSVVFKKYVGKTPREYREKIT